MKLSKALKTTMVILTLVSLVNIVAYAQLPQVATVTVQLESPQQVPQPPNVWPPPFEGLTYDLFISFPSDLEIMSIDLDFEYTPAYIEWTSCVAVDNFSSWSMTVNPEKHKFNMYGTTNVTIGSTPQKCVTLTCKSTVDAVPTIVKASLNTSSANIVTDPFWNEYEIQDGHDVMLPVELSLFAAESVDNGIKILWRTETELSNLGFDVYRGENPDGKFVKISPVYIKGAGTDATPRDYKFVDESAVVGKTYYYYIESISFNGERERSHIIEVIIDATGKTRVTGLMSPPTSALLQNFPNPFNPETWIPFHLAADADVTIRIFDLRGKEIRTIHLGQKSAGYYDTRGKATLWDGRDSYGQEVSSGIYFYNITAGKFHATKKLTIIK